VGDSGAVSLADLCLMRGSLRRQYGANRGRGFFVVFVMEHNRHGGKCFDALKLLYRQDGRICRHRLAEITWSSDTTLCTPIKIAKMRSTESLEGVHPLRLRTISLIRV
jgi:hypothetical protein